LGKFNNEFDSKPKHERFMTDHSQFYQLCLKRLISQGIEPKLASQVAQIQAYVDGTRRRSQYEQEIVDRVWEKITDKRELV
jgi:hypothetical protein